MEWFDDYEGNTEIESEEIISYLTNDPERIFKAERTKYNHCDKKKPKLQ
jgi:hypothetical protein